MDQAGNQMSSNLIRSLGLVGAVAFLGISTGLNRDDYDLVLRRLGR